MALTAEWLESYRLQAQAANKRLQRLERFARTEGNQGSLRWAYAKAQEDIKALRGEGKRRFQAPPKKLPDDPGELRRLEQKLRRSEKAIHQFREMPSSSVGGLKNIYKKRAKSFSEAAGEDLSEDDLKVIFELGLWELLVQYFGSKTAHKVLGEIKQHANDLKKLKQQHRAIRMPEDTEFGSRLNEIFKENRNHVRILTRYLDALGVEDE